MKLANAFSLSGATADAISGTSRTGRQRDLGSRPRHRRTEAVVRPTPARQMLPVRPGWAAPGTRPPDPNLDAEVKWLRRQLLGLLRRGFIGVPDAIVAAHPIRRGARAHGFDIEFHYIRRA